MSTTILSPGMRFTLIHEIKDLADLGKQKKEWVSKDRNDAFWYHLTNETDFLWEGIPFQEFPQEQIGYTLKNKVELESILRLINTLETVLTTIGKKQTDSAYLDSPLWNDVVKAAKDAYEILMKDENLDALLEAEEKRVVV